MAGKYGQLMGLAAVIFFTVTAVKQTEGRLARLDNIGSYDLFLKPSGQKQFNRVIGIGEDEGAPDPEMDDLEDFPIRERRRPCNGYLCCLAMCAQHMFSMHPVIKNGRCYCSS
ncbi:uncharacterized protein [Branchiostoma lanceolatum]|uniref:uncharacterized protein n=1 Tax=Branchiostoma lanceolatum TaxID=7740 RepID=UPI0034571769